MLTCLVFGLLCAFFVAGNDDLFCKDPDTLKYYPVNSTWKSTTFCGNYTCKIRLKNKTTTEYIPSNVTLSEVSLSNSGDALENEDFNDTCPDCNEINTDDRYLNRKEVNSLAKFLYSVKRSELENLLEFYNMVNEMNTEMVSSATEYNQAFNANIGSDQYYQAQGLNPLNIHSNAHNNIPNYENIENIDTLHKMFVKKIDNPTNPYQYPPQPDAIPENGRVVQLSSSPVYEQTQSPHEEMHTDAATTTTTRDSSHPFFYPGFNYQIGNEQIKLPKLYQISRAPNGYPILLNPENHVYPRILVAMPTSKLTGMINRNPLKHYGYPQTDNTYYNYSPLQNSDIIRQNYYTTKEDLKSRQTPCSWRTPQMSDIDLDKIRAHMHPKKSHSNNFGIFAAVNRKKSDKIDKIMPIYENKRKARSIKVKNLKTTTEIPLKIVVSEEFNVTNVNEPVESSTQYTITTNKNISQNESESDADKLFEIEKERIIQQIQMLEQDLRSLETSVENKKEENDSMETYIITERCNLASEPGFFRAGDSDLPFPLCCPQKIA